MKKTKRKQPTKRKRGRPRKDEVVVKPLKLRRRGPQKEEEEINTSSEYNRPTKTTIERNRKRRAARHNCILCREGVVTSKIVRHLSLEHCYPLKLRNYILDITEIRNQQQGKSPKINDCTTCLRRFVATRSHRHHFDYCNLIEVPDCFKRELQFPPVLILSCILFLSYVFVVHAFFFCGVVTLSSVVPFYF